MSFILQIIGFLLPSVVVFLTAYFLIKEFFKREECKNILESKALTRKDTLMLQLQAYERMILFLERIEPAKLVIRLNKENLSAHDFHIHLLSVVRAEFEHNIAQQLYISKESWQKLNATREEIVKLINLSKDKIADNDTALNLAKTILSFNQQYDNKVEATIGFLKDEAKKLF